MSKKSNRVFLQYYKNSTLENRRNTVQDSLKLSFEQITIVLTTCHSNLNTYHTCPPHLWCISQVSRHHSPHTNSRSTSTYFTNALCLKIDKWKNKCTCTSIRCYFLVPHLHLTSIYVKTFLSCAHYVLHLHIGRTRLALGIYQSHGTHF